MRHLGVNLLKNIEIEGLDELVKLFDKFGDDAIPHIKAAADDAGDVILSKAKQKVPVKEGKLRDNLKLTKAKGTKSNPYNITAKVGFSSKTAHGVPLELGHRLVYFGKQTDAKVEGKPFLRPAADESKNDVEQAITQALDKALKELDK